MNNLFCSVPYSKQNSKPVMKKKYNSYKKNIHVGPSSGIYMSNIFGSATTKKQN